MKNQFLSFLLAIFCTGLFAQNNDYMWKVLQDNAADYDSICTAYENYLQTTYPDSIPKSAIGAVKRYHRHKYFWNSRLGLDNGQTSYLPYNKALTNISDPLCDGSDDANWELLGPSSHANQTLGLVQEV